MAAVKPYCPALIVLTSNQAQSGLISKAAQTALQITQDSILEFNASKGNNPLATISKLPFIRNLSKDTTALLIFIDKVVALNDKGKYLSEFYNGLHDCLQEKVACLATIVLGTGVKNSNEENITRQILSSLSTVSKPSQQFQLKADGSNLPRLCLEEGTAFQAKPQARLKSVLQLFEQAIGSNDNGGISGDAAP
ncbi:MAG: hypothetical protein O3C63_03780 [Cyanobacteria bacterium]|nr:hypothetical protein [Cyanobacteriota bacterium]MDA1020355.1 hypothetical protein [Cyanobacteriota bacterium]